MIPKQFNQQQVSEPTNINDATNANTSMDTTIGEITQSLGALSGSLTSLQAYQNVATTTQAHLIQARSNLQDTDFAEETAKITKQSLIRNYALQWWLLLIVKN